MNKNYILIVITLAIASCTGTSISTKNSSEQPDLPCDDSFPLAATQKGISGYVQLSYDIDKEGHTKNIEVIKSVPENVFSEVGKCVISKWKYKPKVVDGTPVYQSGLKVQLDYNI